MHSQHCPVADSFEQGRLVKGTTASTPAAVVLQPGDKLLMANGMNLEMWGKQRTQDVRAVTLRPT
jgi:hypothetical protein